MKRKTKNLPYKDNKEFDEANIRVVADMLPPPHEIKASLSNPIIRFLKSKAKKANVRSQRLVHYAKS